MRTRIVKLSDAVAVSNFSARFHTLPEAVPENYDKKLSEKEYNLLASYFSKIVKGQNFGISDSLANKIQAYLKATCTVHSMSDLFSSEEEEQARSILVRLYNTVTDTRTPVLTAFDFKLISSVKPFRLNSRGVPAFNKAYRVKTISESSGIPEEEITLAQEYFSFIESSTKKITFDSSEQKQMNVVLLHILSLAEKKKEFDITALKRKLSMLMEL